MPFKIIMHGATLGHAHNAGLQLVPWFAGLGWNVNMPVLAKKKALNAYHVLYR